MAFLEKKQSLRLYRAVTKYKVITKRSQQYDKKMEIPGAVLHKLRQGRGQYRKLARQCLNLREESEILMSTRKIKLEQRQT